MARLLTHQQLVSQLHRRAHPPSNQTILAKQLGICASYLCDILKGRREISAYVAEKLGYQRELRYREKE